MFEKEITFDRFIRGVMAITGLGLTIYVINLLSAVLLPFFIAWFLAYMIYPTVKFFQYRLHLHNRVLCIAITLLLILAAITGFFYLIIPPAISEFMRFRNLIADYIKEPDNFPIARSIEEFLRQNIDQNAFVKLLHENNMVEALREAVNQLWNLLSQTFNIIIALLGFCVILLYLFFILMDYEKLSVGWIKLVPKRSRRFASALVDDVQHGMNSYIRRQSLVAFLVGILFSIGFLIIDFPLAIGLGMFIGVLNLIPYMQAIGLIPTVLLALLKAHETGGNFWLILLSAGIVFVVVQTIQDAYLVPKIMGKFMGLNPAVILLSLSVWGYLLGLIGLIIALPTTTLLLSYYRRFIERDERKVMLAEDRIRRPRFRQTAKASTFSAGKKTDTTPVADEEAKQAPKDAP